MYTHHKRLSVNIFRFKIPAPGSPGTRVTGRNKRIRKTFFSSKVLLLICVEHFACRRQWHARERWEWEGWTVRTCLWVDRRARAGNPWTDAPLPESSPPCLHTCQRGNFEFFFFFYVRYSTLLHLPHLRLRCAGGCWDRTKGQLRLYGIGCQTV